jgi:hypothetical protein
VLGLVNKDDGERSSGMACTEFSTWLSSMRQGAVGMNDQFPSFLTPDWVAVLERFGSTDEQSPSACTVFHFERTVMLWNPYNHHHQRVRADHTARLSFRCLVFGSHICSRSGCVENMGSSKIIEGPCIRTHPCISSPAGEFVE